jgi:hypothetical protein
MVSKTIKSTRFFILGVILLGIITGCGGGGEIVNPNPLKILGFDPPSAPPGRIVKMTCSGVNGQSQTVSIAFNATPMTVISYGDNFIRFITPALTPGSYQVDFIVNAIHSDPAEFNIEPIPDQPYTQEEFANVMSGGISEILSAEKSNFNKIRNGSNLYSDEQYAAILDGFNTINIMCQGLNAEILKMTPDDAKLLQCLYNEVGLLDIFSAVRDASCARVSSDFTSTFHPWHLGIYALDQISMVLTNAGSLIDMVNLAAAIGTIITGGAATPVLVISFMIKVVTYTADYIIDTYIPTDFTYTSPHNEYPIEITNADGQWSLHQGNSKKISVMGYFRCQDNWVSATLGYILDMFVAKLLENPAITEPVAIEMKDTLLEIFEGLGIADSKLFIDWIGQPGDDRPVFDNFQVEMDMSIYNIGLFNGLNYLYPGMNIGSILDSVFNEILFNVITQPSVIIGNESYISYDFSTEYLSGLNVGETTIYGMGYSMVPQWFGLWKYELQQWESSNPYFYVNVTTNQPPVWNGTAGIQTAAPGNASITVTFGTATDPDGDNPVTYDLYYSDQTQSGNTNPFSSPNAVQSNVTTPSYTLTGLTNNHTYYLGVRAKDSKGLSETNTVTKFATPYGTNRPPVWNGSAGIQSATPGDARITVTFGTATDPDGDNPVTYNLYYCDHTSTGDIFPDIIIKGVVSPYQFTGLPNGHEYYLAVYAQDSKGLEDTNDIKILATPKYDPFNPIAVKTIDTPGFALGVYVANDYAYVADEGSGLQIIDIDPPSSAQIVKSIYIDDGAYEVCVQNGYAYVSCAYSFKIIDVSPPGSSYIVKSIDGVSGGFGFSIIGNYAYVANGYQGLQIIDITPPESAYIVKTVDTPDLARDVYVYNNYAYVADWESGLQIIDIDPPNSAYIVKSVVMPDWDYTGRICVSNGFAYMSNGVHLQVIDIVPPESAHIANTVFIGGVSMGKVFISDRFAYVCLEVLGTPIIDINLPESAYIVRYIPKEPEDIISDVYVSGNYAYVAAGSSGLKILKLW